jgi:hypothetical protein
MSKRWGLSILVASVLAGLAAAFADDATWVFDFETTRQSSEAVETSATPANLCEGTQGYLTGGDPGWVRVSGDPNPNQPFFEARG